MNSFPASPKLASTAFQSPTGICECVNAVVGKALLSLYVRFQSPTGICECVNHKFIAVPTVKDNVSVPYGDL